MVKVREALRLDFGQHGTEAGNLGDGWGEPEFGFRWMLDTRSKLTLPLVPTASRTVLALVVEPLTVGELIPKQRLAVAMNGKSLRAWSVRTPMVLIVELETKGLTDPGDITLVLDHPDAVCLSPFLPPPADNAMTDPRSLSLNVSEMLLMQLDGLSARPPVARPIVGSAVTGGRVTDADILMQLASLGDNCEFGLFQRRHGAEPMDLFRFSGIRLESLALALEEDLASLCDPAELTFELRGEAGGREYILHHRRYDFHSHTLVIEGTVPVGRLIEREIKKLFFCRRLLMDDLASGDRLFVYKRNSGMSPEEAERLAAALQRHGDNALLYVGPAADGAAPGHVEKIGDGLFRGHMDTFLDYAQADAPASDTWLKLCRNAHALWRVRNHGPLLKEAGLQPRQAEALS